MEYFPVRTAKVWLERGTYLQLRNGLVEGRVGLLLGSLVRDDRTVLKFWETDFWEREAARFWREILVEVLIGEVEDWGS